MYIHDIPFSMRYFATHLVIYVWVRYPKYQFDSNFEGNMICTCCCANLIVPVCDCMTNKYRYWFNFRVWLICQVLITIYDNIFIMLIILFLIVCFTNYFVFSIAVLPHIYCRARDQNSWGCPLLFSNRNLGSLCAYGTDILDTHSLWEVVDHSRSNMHETCLIIIHDPGMRPGPQSNRGPLD